MVSKQPEKVVGDEEDQASAAEEMPTCFDTSEFGKFLEVYKDKLTVKYTGDGRHDNDVGSIQANRKVPREQLVYYYEMRIVDTGEKGLISIGFAEKGFKMGRHPGWEPNSYGYHAEYGKKLTGVVQPSRTGGEDYGPSYTTGDVVGAGIHLERQEMFFTKNGRHLGTAFRNVLKVPLYATVGLHSRNECIQVNFGEEPFQFDLEDLIQEERSLKETAVMSAEVPSGMSHQIVWDYLLHYGYADTLASFVQSAGLATPDAAGPSTSGHSRIEENTLALRYGLRQALMGGQVDQAISLLEKSLPADFRDLSKNSFHVRTDNLHVYFYLKCLAFIELIRDGKIDEAVNFAREVLSQLRGQFTHRSPNHDAMLADVVALLAYIDPQASPMKALLDQGQREAVADAINAAVLDVASGVRHSWKAPPQQSVLEKLLVQLVAVQRELHAANGGHGQVFRLRDYLLPPTPRPSTPNINGAAHNGSANLGSPNGTSH